MAFAEDLSVFFDTDEFADAVTYNGAPLAGIFDNAYFEGQGIQGSQPVFTCPTADVASARHGDLLVRAGVTYKVVGVEPDGTGITLLRLEKQ
ncbi:hypothetical protein C8R31_101662 [Nitrosospira sp. Nsp2]|uniref:head-tail joining protein n=1 Tax=Nitrosospira sp. Nsp2 TaxID=136548 RepID=UPI000D315549|nr:hypothetical protein [Nitrosospira sp. Nsp2]PTR17498.1 hypothetical protein C8R31_101662 [Nitrosospira sp. Nsp2]